MFQQGQIHCGEEDQDPIETCDLVSPALSMWIISNARLDPRKPVVFSELNNAQMILFATWAGEFNWPYVQTFYMHVTTVAYRKCEKDDANKATATQGV